MPNAPVSWGELIDKITILEIKSVEIANEAARANVQKELRFLEAIAASTLANDQLGTMKAELKLVNSALWKIEDAIRDKERAGAFDSGFVELARAVYKHNDERGRIKRRINEALGSDLIEEKAYAAY